MFLLLLVFTKVQVEFLFYEKKMHLLSNLILLILTFNRVLCYQFARGNPFCLPVTPIINLNKSEVMAHLGFSFFITIGQNKVAR
jgi:hypothetical protein